MTDTDTDRYFAHHAMIQRVAKRIQRSRSLTTRQRLADLHKATENQQKANETFCKNFPWKCGDCTAPVRLPTTP